VIDTVNQKVLELAKDARFHFSIELCVENENQIKYQNECDLHLIGCKKVGLIVFPCSYMEPTPKWVVAMTVSTQQDQTI
jgi:hypothetical protein